MSGSFEVIIESKENGKNIGNYITLSIARQVFNLNLSEIKKMQRKGRNIVGIIINNFKYAYLFLKDNLTSNMQIGGQNGRHEFLG